MARTMTMERSGKKRKRVLAPKKKAIPRYIKRKEINERDLQNTRELLNRVKKTKIKLPSPDEKDLQIKLLRICLKTLFEYVQAEQYGFTLDLIESYLDDVYTPYYRNEKKIVELFDPNGFAFNLYDRTVSISYTSNFDLNKMYRFLAMIHEKHFVPVPLYAFPIFPYPDHQYAIFYPCHVSYRLRDCDFSIFALRRRIPVESVESYYSHSIWLLWYQDGYQMYHAAPAPTAASVESEANFYLSWLPEELVRAVLEFVL
jgi:hypothetical protein